MIRLCRLFVILYLMLSVVALALVPLSDAGLLGLKPDPLAGIWAVLLAMPWSILADGLFSEHDTLFNLALVGAGMAVNALVLAALCRLMRRLRRPA